MPQPLSDHDIRQALADLPGWHHEDDKLRVTYTFGSFAEAVSFITRLAFEAEKANHHPTIHNTYDTVKLELSTHDADGKVTQKDMDLAKTISDFSWRAPERA